jgi:hypothetical protein
LPTRPHDLEASPLRLAQAHSMFRAQSNIFDDVVTKATDENLTSENWEYILVCTSSPTNSRVLVVVHNSRTYTS